VLERAGSSWDDVVDMTTYHVDIDASMPALASVKNRYVKAPFPAWTAIDIDRLFAPEGEVEIKITARLSPKPPMVSAPEFLPNTGSSTPFSRAVQVGDTLYLAGQLGLARRGDEDQQNGIEAETRRAMERIGGTLALYGLSHDALFKCTVWLAEISDFAAFNTVYRGFFQEGRYPTRSTMAVKELAAGAQIEIECVAHNPASPAKSLAAAMSRPFVAPEPSSSGEVLSDFRPRIAPLGEGQWVYLQRNRGDVPYRQRVLQLLDNPDGSVTQIAWSLSAPEAFTDAPSQPDVLKSLEPSMLVATFSEGCSQEWRYTVGPEPAWTGVVNPETCVIMSERRGVEIRIGAEAKITPEGMFEAERGFSLEGEQIWGTPEGEYALIMRAG
jgi:reactive intermediate/imine deaminase